MTNIRADALSRQSSSDDVKEDNNDVIVLPTHVFANATFTTLNEVDELC